MDPKANYPDQHYPQQNYAPQGYPQPGYPQQGYPQQGYDQGPSNTTMIITQAPQSRPPNYLWASILTCLCCNCVLGIIAIIFSVMSMSDADSGQMESARSNGRVAMWLSVAALILGIISLIVLIVLYAVVWKDVYDTARDCSLSNYQNCY